VLEVIEYILH